MRDIDLSGGHDIGAKRREAVGRLAEQPLRGAALQVPRREVVARRIAEDGGGGLFLSCILDLFPNDDDKLRLVVKLLRARGQSHLAA